MVNRLKFYQCLARNSCSRLIIHMEQVRHGHHLRGNPPTIARNLKQRLEIQDKTDPTISFKVDIGFSMPKTSRKVTDGWMSERKRLLFDPKVEKEARDRLLSIDLEEVKEIWLKTVRPFDVGKIAEHYGIFQDLFGDAYFRPVLPLDIEYEIEDEKFVKVHTGNVIKPEEASKRPTAKYIAEPNTLWTLIMCTPDGNMENSNNEYCHWFLGNIPENKVEHAEEIIDYLKPIPPRGIGYYRYVFVLYKQDGHLDYAEYKKTKPCLQLKSRDWNTLEFYRKYQDYLTPAGLAFFQSDWDSTVTQCYHGMLDTKEPVFHYDFPKAYIKRQKWFPRRQPFNLYLDKYRDPKEIAKEFLLRKLKNVDPFREARPPLRYPNALTFDKYIPSWLKVEMKKSRLGWGRINDIK